jgi:hypothetical protein
VGTKVVEAEPVRDEVGRAHGDRSFTLRVGGSEFGILWAGRDGCSLRWRGNLAFPELHAAATIELPMHFPSSDNHRPSVTATLRLVNGDYRRFILPREGEELSAAYDYPDRLAFARYDLVSANGLSAALTADNPALKERAYVAILFSTWRCWSSQLLTWVVSHHLLRHKIETAISLQRSSETLTQLCHSQG